MEEDSEDRVKTRGDEKLRTQPEKTAGFVRVQLSALERWLGVKSPSVFRRLGATTTPLGRRAVDEEPVLGGPLCLGMSRGILLMDEQAEAALAGTALRARS